MRPIQGEESSVLRTDLSCYEEGSYACCIHDFQRMFHFRLNSQTLEKSNKGCIIFNNFSYANSLPVSWTNKAKHVFKRKQILSTTKTAHHIHHLEKSNFSATICSKCNLKIQSRYQNIPIFCHNFSRFDHVLIIKENTIMIDGIY